MSRIVQMPVPRPSYDLGPARAVVGGTPVLAVDHARHQLAEVANAVPREVGALLECLLGGLASLGGKKSRKLKELQPTLAEVMKRSPRPTI